jgi:membrane protein involved in colicin uptake
MEYEEHLRLQEANSQIARLESERRMQHELFDRQREEDLRRKRWELEQIRNEKLEAERRTSDTSRLEERERAIKREMKNKMLQDEIDRKNAEAKLEAERDRILLENERAKAKAKAEEERLKLIWKAKEDEEEEERKQLISEAQRKAELKKKKEDDEEKAAIARWEQKKADQKKEEEALREKFKLEEAAKKAKEKAEEEAWALKLKLKKEAEEAKEKARQKEIEDEMHKKLAVFGFQENQIQAVLDPKKAGDLPAGYAPGQARPARPAIGWNQPTYIKVSREHLDVETLKYYNLRYEIDGVGWPFYCRSKRNTVTNNHV